MKYQLADLVNGQYGEIFESEEEAQQALKDAIAEGKKMNLESSDGESDMGSYNGQPQTVEEFISLVEIPEVVSLEDWQEEFQKLSKQYMDGINWEAVIFEDHEFGQAADEIQLSAYRNLYAGDDCNPNISDWEFYEDSCDDRAVFQRELEERYSEYSE